MTTVEKNKTYIFRKVPRVDSCKYNNYFKIVLSSHKSLSNKFRKLGVVHEQFLRQLKSAVLNSILVLMAIC